MSELFVRVMPKSDLEWTGERLTSATTGQIEIEHLHRYFLSRQVCRNLDVLDIASGEGYGAALLAQVAKSVVGVDISPHAIKHASENYLAHNLSYIVGDARAIPLRDNTVDVVVSLETIEHLSEHNQFLLEVKRVLRAGGIFVVSSPNKEITQPGGTVENPFHELELSRQEFCELLSNNFSNISFLEQRAILGSLLASEEGSSWTTFENLGDSSFKASDGISECTHMVIVATDSEYKFSNNSIYIENNDVGLVLSEFKAYNMLADAYKSLIIQAEAQNKNVEDLLANIDFTKNELLYKNRLLSKLTYETNHKEDNLKREKQSISVYKKFLLDVMDIAGEQILNNLPSVEHSILIEQSDLFDATIYAGSDEAAAMGMTAAEHYLRIGEAAGLSPSRGFDPIYYAMHNSDVTASGSSLLVHYLQHGRAEGRKPFPTFYKAEDISILEQSVFFDAATYAGSEEAAAMGMTASEHYLRIGEAAGLPPSRGFDPVYYAMYNSDVLESKLPLLIHYLQHGRAEGRQPVPAAHEVENMEALEEDKDLDTENQIVFSIDGRVEQKKLQDIHLEYTDIEIIEGSGLFDATTYAGSEEAAAMGMTAAEHYLRFGEAAGLSPSRGFDPSYYADRNPDIGATSMNRLLHYIQHGRSEGRQSLPGSSEAADIAALEESDLFDATTYAGSEEAAAMGMTAAEHYLRFGEAAGLSPSRGFDPSYYADRNPDIGATSMNRLLHYIQHGRLEGRQSVPLAHTLELDQLDINLTRPSVAIVVHEGSRTGAPILAWNIATVLSKKYNVFTLLKRSGAIESHFKGENSFLIPCFRKENETLDLIEYHFIVKKLCSIVKFDYVIANSVETREFASLFEENGVPAVALVHEFSSYTKPQGSLQDCYGTASEIVFSSNITLKSSLLDYPQLWQRSYRVIPQGSSIVPSKEPNILNNKPVSLFDLRIDRSEFLVLGMGWVQVRKGVDIFISVAAEVKRIYPEAKIKFHWVGGGYDPIKDMNYSIYLREQLFRSGFDDSFFIDEVEDLEPYFERAQLLLLSSRLDPLPNVAIDALLNGVPVVSFEDASGIADLLSKNYETADLVVPHLGVRDAANLVVQLYDDPERLDRLSKSVANLAKNVFDMSHYVEHLDKLGQQSKVRMEKLLLEEKKSEYASCVNLDMLLNSNEFNIGPEQALRKYLITSKNFLPWSRVGAGNWLRRPMLGFNPLIYASDCPSFLESQMIDPFIHYLDNNCPQGRWTHKVLEPNQAYSVAKPMSIALHGHFHYPELLNDLIDRILVNQSSCDLYLTTTTIEKSDKLKSILIERGFDAEVYVVPNLGRDIGAFITGVLPLIIDRYEIIGHIHGKKSLRVNALFGDTWRNFLWEHLIGSRHPMMDRVIDAFYHDSQLGLVFPLDPHLIGWTENQEIAESMAQNLGMNIPLASHFEFPIGTMFWSRAEALRPLLQLSLDWKNYPVEPIKDDGTILHSLERLLPFVVEMQKYKFSTTYVPGVRR